MTECKQGYRCEVCGLDVIDAADSDLYLRYVIGAIDAGSLCAAKERHIRCNPVLAQFIVDDDFEPVTVEGQFDKRTLDREHVKEKESLVTRGWRRLRRCTTTEEDILNYPLPEVQARTLRR